MGSDAFMNIVIFLVLLSLSAFFSSAETAFFSLSRASRNRLKEKNIKRANRALTLLADPKNLLITILVGNTIVNVAAAAIAALMAVKLSRDLNFSENLAILIEVVVVTFILLTFGEITPKIFAVKNATWLVELFSFPIYFLSKLFYPIIKILAQFPMLISKIIASRADRHYLSKDELKSLIEVSEQKGTLIQEEREMIDSIFEFGKTSVKEIMIPRIDMVCVDKKISFKDLVDTIEKKGHTRIPVYDESIDNILGILHAKELLSSLSVNEEMLNLEPLVRTALFIPESKMIDELLKDFQKEKKHMAIVVDEYGGTSGLITLEDVIEEIVGEIQDEYDIEKQLYHVLEDGTIIVDAKIDLDELNDQLKLNLPYDPNYESLGGFILNLTGSLPDPEEEILYENYKFIIEKVEKNRIIKVRIKKTSNHVNNN